MTKSHDMIELPGDLGRPKSGPVLLLAHEKLDAAVAAAYGWQPDGDDDGNQADSALNLER